MSYTNDLTNLANIASVVISGITSNGTAITKISVGNSTVNSIVNSTGIYVNGSVIYQTTAGLSANVLVLTSNAATYLGNSSGTLANIQNYITGNAATAYTNATSYTDTKAGTAYTNAITYSANATNISSGTVAPARLGTGTANSTTILYGNGVFAAAPDSTNASALTSGTVAPARLGSGTANSTTILYGNSVFAAAPDSTNASALISGTVNVSLLASYGTANSTTILYGNSVWGPAPSSTNASALTTGVVNASLLASFGTANSSTILYGNSVWAAAPGAPVAGGNTIITTGNGSNQAITLSSAAIAANDIIVTFNGLRQTPNSYAVTSGILYVTAPSNSDIVVQLAGGPTGPTGPYYPGGGNTIITTGTGANQSVILSSNAIVANDIIVTFNGLRQTPNSYIVTTGTLYVTAPANSDIVVQLAGGIQGAAGATGANGASLVALVQQQYTANGTDTQFAVSGGYSAGAMTVYVNGVKQLETTDVITSSGANVVFNTAPPSNAQIDIFGFSSLPQIASNTSVVSQQFTANGIANSFIVSGGYTAGSMQVFVNGVKYVESSDVVTNSGTTINFTTAPANGSIVDVFGQVSLPAVTANSLLLIGGTVSGTINVGSNVSITTTGVNVGSNVSITADGITINNFKTVTANYLLLSTDYIVQANNALTLTLMAASTVAGKQFFIRNINTSDVNIVGNTSSETINGYANVVMQFKNSSLGLISTGSSWIIN